MGEKLKTFFADRTVRIILICIAALVLLFAVWKVFFGESNVSANGYQATEQEERLAALLMQIDGVEKATVMIGEEDGKAVNAVVVFDGKDGIITRLRITEVAASALNLKNSSILVYSAA